MKSLKHYDINASSKRVAFDIGNVLCHVDIDAFFQFLVDNYREFPNKEKANLFLESIQAGQDLGVLTMKFGLYQVFPYLDDKHIADICHAWTSTVTFSDPMMGLVEKLLTNNWKVALLSNIGRDHSEFVRGSHHVFDWCIRHFSCEVGARKPTKLYFQSFIQDSGWGVKHSSMIV